MLLSFLLLVLLSCFTTEGRKETAYKRGTLDPVPKRSHRHSKHQQSHGNRRDALALHLPHTRFTCGDIQFMLRKKDELTKIISKIMAEMQGQKDFNHNQSTSNVKGLELKTRILTLYQSELNASQEALNDILASLNQTLYSDYHSLDIIRLSCKSRLAKLQSLVLRATSNHNEALKLVGETKAALGQNLSQTHHKLIGDILTEISIAADKLEYQLKDDTFHSLIKIFNVNGFKLVVTQQALNYVRGSFTRIALP